MGAMHLYKTRNTYLDISSTFLITYSLTGTRGDLCSNFEEYKVIRRAYPVRITSKHIQYESVALLL